MKRCHKQTNIPNYNKNNVMKTVENTNIFQKSLNHSMAKVFFFFFFLTFKDNGIYKVRLVVIDFPQIKGVDYTSTYSSTIEMNSFRQTITITSSIKKI